MHVILNKLMYFIQNDHLNKKNEHFVASLSKCDKILLT
jgi:hypothetical protein